MRIRRVSRSRRPNWAARFTTLAVVVALAAGVVVLDLHHSPPSAPSRQVRHVEGCRLGASASAGGARVSTWSLIAELRGPTPAYSSPRSQTPSLQLNATWSSVTSLPVVTASKGWLQVRLVARSNSQTEWIKASSCSLTRTRYHVVVDLARHRLLLFRLGTLTVDAP